MDIIHIGIGHGRASAMAPEWSGRRVALVGGRA
jgi:hypothetical protein